MRKGLRYRIAFLLAMGILGNACEESSSVLPSLYEDATEDATVIYRAPEALSLRVEGAWTPSAAVDLDGTAWMYADCGTRQIVEASALAGDAPNRRVVWDLSSLESRIGAAPWGSGWGRDLLRVGLQSFILAGENRALIWLDAETGEKSVVGRADGMTLAGDFEGMTLDEVDFSRFSGMGRGERKIYLALGNSIYVADIGDGALASVRRARLERLAGAPDVAAEGAWGNALEIGLALDGYSHILESGDILYFWEISAQRFTETPRLRAFKKGRIVTVTGDGYEMPSCDLHAFYARYLPNAPAFWLSKGKLYSAYWSGAENGLEIAVDAIDFETGDVRGTVDLRLMPPASTSGVVPFGEDFLAFDSKAGSFWRINSDDIEMGEKLFGAVSSAERESDFWINGSSSPFALNDLLVPLTMAPLLNGALSLVYSPTIQRFSALEISTGRVEELMEGALEFLTTDGKKNVWYKDGSALNFLKILEDGSLDSSYVAKFFREPSATGSPCEASVWNLGSEIPEIGALSNGCVAFQRKEGVSFSFDASQNRILDQIGHLTGWFIPSHDSASEFYSSGIDTTHIAFWTSDQTLMASIWEKDGAQYLLVSNLFLEEASFLSKTISSEKTVIFSGQGETALADGVALKDASLSGITALAIDAAQNRLWVGLSDGRVFEAEDSGIWHRVDSVCFDGIREPIVGLSAECSGADCTFAVTTAEQMALCRAKTGDMRVFSSSERALTACGGNSWGFARGDAVCVLSGGFAAEHEHCTDIAFPDADRRTMEIHFSTDATSNPHAQNAVVCQNDTVFVSVQVQNDADSSNDSSHAVKRAGILQGKISKNGAMTWEKILGMGDGLPEETTLSRARFGTDVGAIYVDENDVGYLWLRDTCTIWRIPKATDMQADSMAYRVWTNPMLCDAQSLAFDDDGHVAVATEGKILLKSHEKPEKDISVLSNFPVVYDMIFHAGVLAILTPEGLYTSRDGNTTKRLDARTHALNSEPGEQIFYAYPVSEHKRLAKNPAKSSIWIPSYEAGIILEVPLVREME